MDSEISQSIDGFSSLIAASPNVIIALCCMGAVIIVGWTNFFFPKRKLKERATKLEEERWAALTLDEKIAEQKVHEEAHEIKIKRKKIVILIIACITTVFASPLIPAIWTLIYFILGLLVAISTIAYDAVFNGIGNVVEQGLKNIGSKL